MPAEPVTFEPHEQDIQWTSAQAGDDAKDIDYTIAQLCTSKPKDNDIEEQLKLQIQAFTSW